MDTKQLKAKILDLAIRGKLVPQEKIENGKLTAENDARLLLQKIREEKEAKIKAGELKRDKNDSYIFVGDDNRHYEKFVDGTVKDIEDEIPFDVPAGWAWCRAKQLYNIRSAIRIHQSDWQSNGIPFFRGRELVELCKTGDVHPKIFISEELYEENKKKGGVPQKNDLLVSAVGTLGFVHIVEGTKKFYYKDAYILCFENHFNLNPFYMKKVIESDYIQKVIYGGSKGTTVDQLTIENAKALWIPLPPLPEQKQIVSEIERIFTLIDSIENDKSDLQTAIKQAKSKILDLAIRGKLVPQEKIENGKLTVENDARLLLEKIREEKEAKINAGELKRDKNDSYIYKSTTDNRHYEKFANGTENEIEVPFEIPENWCWCRLSTICDYGKCKNASVDELSDKSWILDLEDIEKDTGRIIKFVNYKDRKSLSSKHIFYKGDLLYSKLRPYLNKVVIAPKDGFCTSEILPLDFKGVLINKFAQILFMSSFFLTTVNFLTYGVKMPRLGTDDAKKILLPLPPLEEQQRIVEKIEDIFASLNFVSEQLD